MACEIGNDVGVSQSRRSIDAEHRLEAYTTLRLRFNFARSRVLNLQMHLAAI